MTPPNFFIGFPASDAWIAPVIRTLPPGLRTFWGDDIHVTLAFLGPCGPEAARAAWSSLGEPTHTPLGQPAITVQLGAIEPFGPPARPSALSVVPVDPDGPLTERLAQHRDPLLAAAGRPAENRPPRPHLTIARIPRDATPELRRDALAWAEAQPPVGVSIELRELALYTWCEDRSQLLYQIIARRPLRT